MTVIDITQNAQLIMLSGKMVNGLLVSTGRNLFQPIQCHPLCKYFNLYNIF